MRLTALMFLVTGLAACNATDEISNVDFSGPSFSNRSNTPTWRPTPRRPDPAYETLRSRSGKTSNVVGEAVVFETSSGTTTHSIEDVTGTIQHTVDGQVVLNDGYNMVDPDGFDANAEATDGTQLIKLVNHASGYDQVQVYVSNRTDGANEYTSFGYYGIPTRAENLPSSGTASYSGQAEVIYSRKGPGGYVHKGVGTVNVVADFSNNTVDATSNFNIISDESNALVASPDLDEIRQRDMVINNGSFAGGTYEFRKNGVAVDQTGTNTNGLASGKFFGGKTVGNTTRPAEVAGVLAVSGDDGNVFNIFAAD